MENKAARLHEIRLEEWDRVLDINLRGTFLCMKHEIAHMLSQGGGVVVNTSSGAGIRGVAGGASYAASKHAIIGMTESAARKAAETIIPHTAKGTALAGDPGTGAAAACNGHSATAPVPSNLRAMTQPRTGRRSGLHPSSESNILR